MYSNSRNKQIEKNIERGGRGRIVKTKRGTGVNFPKHLYTILLLFDKKIKKKLFLDFLPSHPADLLKKVYVYCLFSICISSLLQFGF